MTTKKSQWVQVGGHSGPQQLMPDGAFLYKPVHTPREKNFYLDIQNRKDWLESNILPKFYGIERREYGYGEYEYIKMENLTYSYQRPFVLDLKIGTQTWDSETSTKKLKKRLSVDSTSTTTSLGLRFSGMERNITGEKPILYSRYLCTHDVSSREALKDYIKLFLFDGKKMRKDLLPFFKERLQMIFSIMSKNEYKMFSTSLLFLYDADADFVDNKFDMKMIDYAHTWRLSNEVCLENDGFCYGLNSLMKILNEIDSEISYK
ncbi:Kinase [Entamoeba marina]